MTMGLKYKWTNSIAHLTAEDISEAGHLLYSKKP